MDRQRLLENYISEARPLRKSKFVEYTRAFWAEARHKIIRDGKKRGNEIEWARLDGFDRAVSIVENVLAAELRKTRRLESPDPTSEEKN